MRDDSGQSRALSQTKRRLLERLRKSEGVREGERKSISQRRQFSPCPLSFAQQRLWLITQLDPHSSAYNIPAAVRVSGELNVKALQQSLNEIIRRHEMLRTSFAEVNGLPAQIIAPELTISLSMRDLERLPQGERESAALQLAVEEAERPFDLSHTPLLRADLFRIRPRNYLLLLVMHHIVSDGWSMGVMIREIAALYEAFSNGNPSPLPELRIQYADFAAWQRDWLKDEMIDEQLSYWKRQLGGSLEELKLPTDRPRPRAQSYGGAHQSFCVSPELSNTLRALARRQRVTLFVALFAALAALLHGYTRQNDIVIATDLANRRRVETEALIGFFVNMLILRTDLSGNPTFEELLRRVREITVAALAHQDLPFERLVEHLQPQRTASDTPLFRVVFALQNMPTPALHLPGLTITPVEIQTSKAKFDLVFNLWDTDHGLEGVAKYSTEIFEPGTIARLLEHYQRLLAHVAAEPGMRLHDLDFLDEQESNLIKKTTAIDELDGDFSF